MKNIVFKGAAVALVTPFKEDNTTDLDLLGRLIDFQIENDIDAIAVCGTTGEASTLSKKEHRQIIETAVKKAKGKVPIIAGAGSNNTGTALSLSLAAEDAGADALLLVTPYYNKTTQTGLIEHYFYIADRTSLPIILYNVPSRTGLNILPETYQKLAEHPNIVAVKEANGNIESIIKTMNLCEDSLSIYSGEDGLTLPTLAVGGIGVISVAANIMPKKMHLLCEAFEKGKNAEAAALQREISEICSALFSETNPIPVKKALTMMGYPVGKGRLPLCEMSEKNEKRLSSVLKKAKLI
ncbi:MAG: 4-hydroxy-tetrahydrodipicolinate synthase [Clostridiales bacterium]|nr:4-hydroxy-tetrahydrodipicolinate synthase [Clostridiales bacterium]